MKTILKSIVLTILVALFCTCVFTLTGLLLNFWNETLLNCLTGVIGALTIGVITYFAIIQVIESFKTS
jgi:hypothetical protein